MNIQDLKIKAKAAKDRPDLQVNDVLFRSAACPNTVLKLISEIEKLRSRLKSTEVKK